MAYFSRSTRTSSRQFCQGSLSDALLWLVLLAIIVAGGMAWYSYGSGRFQRLNLMLGDANEIVAGSNVYFTGVHVGEVEDITLQRDGVEVELKLRPDTPPLPQALTAHIIFSGLAGTKQIHLWPRHDRAIPVRIGHEHVTDIDVDSPIRFRDTLQANTDIAIALKNGADGMGKILSKMYTNPEKPDLPVDPDEVVDKTAQGLGRVTQWTQDTQHWQQTINNMDLPRMNQQMQGMAKGVKTLNRQSQAILATKPLESIQTQLHQAEAIAKPVHRKAVDMQRLLKTVSGRARWVYDWCLDHVVYPKKDDT